MAMINLRLPVPQQNHVLSFLQTSEESLYFQKQLKKALNDLAPSIQSAVTATLFGLVVR